MSNRRFKWLWPTQASMDATYGAPLYGVPDLAWTVLAVPLLQIANAVKYARTYRGAFRRIAVFTRFVPTIVVSTAIWAACWYVVIHMVWLIFHGAI